MLELMGVMMDAIWCKALCELNPGLTEMREPLVWVKAQVNVCMQLAMRAPGHGGYIKMPGAWCVDLQLFSECEGYHLKCLDWVANLVADLKQWLCSTRWVLASKKATHQALWFGHTACYHAMEKAARLVHEKHRSWAEFHKLPSVQDAKRWLDLCIGAGEVLGPSLPNAQIMAQKSTLTQQALRDLLACWKAQENAAKFHGDVHLL